MESGEKLKIPVGNQYHSVRVSKFSKFLKNLINSMIMEVKSDPEIAFNQAKVINTMILRIEPSKHLEYASFCLMGITSEAFEEFGDEILGNLNTCENLKQLIGISSFLGFLFNRGLTDYDIIHTWMMKILARDQDEIAKLNFMEIVKERVNSLRNELDFDENIKEMRKVIADQEEKKAVRAVECTHAKPPKVNPSKPKLANSLIDNIIQTPSRLKSQVQAYKEVLALDKKFGEIFDQAMTERLKNIKHKIKLIINITWIESFKAELCLNGLYKPGEFIDNVVERNLYRSREQTMIFVIIFHKIWKNLKSEDTKKYNKCLGYLQQLVMIFPTHESFWEPELYKIEPDLKSKVLRKQLESFQFKVDKFSFERALFIFKKADEDRNYIPLALSVIENNLGFRLLKVHLSYLCKIKFMTEKLEYDMSNPDNSINIKTNALVCIVKRFYELDIINSQTIMDIVNHLINEKNRDVQLVVCVNMYDKAKEENDPMFALTKKFITHIHTAYEKNVGKPKNNDSNALPEDFKKFIKLCSKGKRKIDSFDYKSLHQDSLKNCSTLLIAQAVINTNSRQIMANICKIIDKSSFKFKSTMKEVLDEHYQVTLDNFGEENLIEKFETKAEFIAVLTVEGFFDIGVVNKLLDKFHKVLNTQGNSENWKSFINIFNIVADMKLWSKSQDDIMEFLKWMDFFYDISDSNSCVTKTLNNFNDQLVPANNAANANPSFKRVVYMILTRSDAVSLKSRQMCPIVEVKNPSECAKYFVDNAIASGKVFDCIAFLYYFNDARFGEDLRRENIKLIPEVTKLIMKYIEDQHTHRRGYDDAVKTFATAEFLHTYFRHYLMNSTNFVKCIDMIVNSIGIEMNEINTKCFTEIIRLSHDELTAKLERPIHPYHRGLFQAINSRNKFAHIQVSENPMTFAEIKAYKGSEMSFVITESLTKVDLTNENLSKYVEYCTHILCHRQKFAAELDLRITEFTAFFISAPSIEQLKWRQITQFGLFLAHLSTNSIIMDDNKAFSNHVLCKVVENFDEYPIGMIEYAKHQVEICRSIPEMMKGEFINNMDIIYIANLKDLNQDIKETKRELEELFNSTLISFDKVPEGISPSFKYFVDNIIRGFEEHKFGITNRSPPFLLAEFFFDNAILYPYTRLWPLIKNLRNYEEHPDRDIIQKIIPFIVTHAKQCFIDEFAKTIKNAKRPIGITKFIANFYIVGYVPVKLFSFFLDKMVKLTLVKPTMCNLMCFHNIVISPGVINVKKLKSYYKNEAAIKSIKKIIDNLELKLEDQGLDEVDCVNIIKA